MSNIEGLIVGGEANFSDDTANRHGASDLMQGLAAGYIVLPYTIPNYLARASKSQVDTSAPEVKEAVKSVKKRIKQLIEIGGTKSPDWFHRRLGQLMWDHCGMARNKAGLEHVLAEIPKLREQFWSDL